MTKDETVIPAHYPQLARLAWNRDPLRPIGGDEALALYEANWRHVNVDALTPPERALIDTLTRRHGAGHFLPSGKR